MRSAARMSFSKGMNSFMSPTFSRRAKRSTVDRIFKLEMYHSDKESIMKSEESFTRDETSRLTEE